MEEEKKRDKEEEKKEKKTEEEKEKEEEEKKEKEKIDASGWLIHLNIINVVSYFRLVGCDTVESGRWLVLLLSNLLLPFS